MKKIIKAGFVIALSIIVSSSAFSQVTADFDKSTDFSVHKVFGFAGWQDSTDQVLNDIDKKRMLDAIDAEFKARGLQFASENFDAVMTLYLVMNKKTSTTAYTNYTGGVGLGMGGYGWGAGVGGAGLGSSTTTYSEDDYTVGTLVIDIYDLKTKKLIWQGTSQSTITENAAKRDKTIPKKIKKLMAKYPVEPKK